MSNTTDAEIIRKLRNKKRRVRYANRTTEQKEADKIKGKEYYHKKYPNARYLIDPFEAMKKYEEDEKKGDQDGE